MNLLLLNEDYLNAELFLATLSNEQPCTSIFAWDSDYFKQQHYSLQRLAFMYEYLASTPTLIYHTTPDQLIDEYTSHHMIDTIYVPDLNHPSLTTLNTSLVLEQLALPSWLAIGEKSYKRFFQFWRAIEPQLF